MNLTVTEIYRDFGTPRMAEPLYVPTRIPEPVFSEIVGMGRSEDGDFIIALAHGESKLLEPHELLEVFTESQAQIRAQQFGKLVKTVYPKRHQLSRKEGYLLVFA